MSSNKGMKIPTRRTVIGVAFALGFVSAGVLSLRISLMASGLLFVLAALSLTPVRQQLRRFSKRPVMASDINIVMIALLIPVLYFYDQGAQQQEAQAALEQQRIRADAFQRRKDEILGRIRNAVDGDRYQEALHLAQPFEGVKDPDLARLVTTARQGLQDAIDDARHLEEKTRSRQITQNLTRQLNSLKPDEAVERQLFLYKQLAKLHPDNAEYAKQVEVYTDKVRDQKRDRLQAREKAREAHEARVAKFGPMPEQSGWDGSYKPVYMYLQQIAHDPGSIAFIGCSQVNYTDQGWLVQCDYRGKNGFGALVRQRNSFIIRHGKVVSMHDADTFVRQ